MVTAAPTIVAIETNSAWVVILAVSLATFPAALLLRRLINRPGALASSLLLGLPLGLPLIAAAFFQKSVLPEVSVLQPLAPELFEKPDWNLLHFMFVADENSGGLVPYAFSGAPGRWLLLLGMAVSSFMLLRRLAGTLALQRVIHRCTEPDPHADRALLERVERLSTAGGLKRPPRVLLLPEGTTGAFVTGGMRAKILIAPSLIAELSDDELDGIVAHEIAHVASLDLPVMMVAGLLRDLVAWNPVAHLALRRLIAERELEADRCAAHMTGKPLAVASSLLKMCELMKTRGRRGAQPALAFARSGAGLRRRVANLLAVADGTLSSVSVGRLPYVAAACLAAILGLQAGAQVARQADFAIVWDSADVDVPFWFKGWEKVRNDGAQIAGAKKEGKPVNAKTFPAAKYPVFGDGYALREKDFKPWIKALGVWANKRGLSARTLTSEVSKAWHAVPVSGAPHIGPFGFYRIDFVDRTLPGQQR